MKKAVFLLLCLAGAVSRAPAQSFNSPLQQGRYVCNGTAFAMQISMFGSGGVATLYEQDRVVSNAVIRTTGSSIAFTFNSGGTDYQGKTWIYTIQDTIAFEGNGESWLRVGAGLSSITGPASPSAGSITNPSATLPGSSNASNAVLQSGNYTLSGGRQRMYLGLSGRQGGGTLHDDNGNLAGEFLATVNGQTLSLAYTSGRHRGITFDYRIVDDATFSRIGETWIRRY